MSYFLVVWACNIPQKTIPYVRSGEVEFMSMQHLGLATYRSKSIASGSGQAFNYAERSLFDNLFFKGIIGSPQATPLIEKENEFFKEHSDFYDFFLKNDFYHRFITNYKVISQNENQGSFYLTEEVTVDLNALRKYLEDNNITRKFGF